MLSDVLQKVCLAAMENKRLAIYHGLLSQTYENRVQMCTVHSVNMITFCSSVIETLQYPMNIAAEHVGLIVDLAESCSQD